MAAPTDDSRVRDSETRPVERTAVVDREGWTPAIGPGLILGGLAAIGVIIALFTEWTSGGPAPDAIPVAFLGDDATSSSDPSLLIVLIPLAVVLVVGAFAPFGNALRILGGIGVLIVCGLFAYQFDQSLGGGADNLGDSLGTGFYVAAVGGFLAFVSGFVPEAWFNRRERVVRSDVA